jgi:hypothetical protein
VNGGQIAFYASVATAIPVVVGLYVVGLRTAASTSSVAWLRVMSRVMDYGSYIGERVGSRMLPDNLGDRPGVGTYLVGACLAAAMFAVGCLGWVALFVVLAAVVFSVVGPMIGEGFALHALASDRATDTATTWATIGIATTGVAILGIFVPVFKQTVRRWQETARDILR